MKVRFGLNKEEVKRMVIEEIRKQFPIANITLDVTVASYSEQFGEINCEVNLTPKKIEVVDYTKMGKIPKPDEELGVKLSESNAKNDDIFGDPASQRNEVNL